jgi:hypothetical protein
MGPLRASMMALAFAACATSEAPPPVYRDVEAPPMRRPQPGDIVEDTAARERQYDEAVARLVADARAGGALGPDLDAADVVDIRELRHGCPVHGVALETDTVPIAYGLIMVDEVEAKISAEFFPLARTEYLAGCVVRRAKQARVRFCPRCRQVQRAFRDERRPAPH